MPRSESSNLSGQALSEQCLTNCIPILDGIDEKPIQRLNDIELAYSGRELISRGQVAHRIQRMLGGQVNLEWAAAEERRAEERRAEADRCHQSRNRGFRSRRA